MHSCKYILLFIIIVWCNQTVSSKPFPPPPPPPPTGLGNFISYVLAIQNPYSYCRNKAIQCRLPQTAARFSIHGLWPQNAIIHSMEPFDRNLPSKVNDLEKKWFNANAVRDKSKWLQFLEHEWKNHGTYSGLSQISYYQAALQQYDIIMTKLSKTKVIGTGINVTTLRNQLNAQALGLPGIVCGQDTMAPNKNLLVEIRFLINHQLTAFGNNPQPYERCDPNVLLYES